MRSPLYLSPQSSARMKSAVSAISNQRSSPIGFIRLAWKKQGRPRATFLKMAWTAAFAASVAAAFAQAEPAPPAHAIERQEDAYAIYSLLMPGEILAKMGSSPTQGWAIAATTVNAEDINPALAPEAALRAPQDNPKLFHEAVRDYNARKDERLLLQRDFHLDRPYRLLTPSEVAEFHTARTAPGASAVLRREYGAYPGITYFSQVFFDSKRTAALVYMSDWCGNLCAQAEWVYLEKQNRRWVRRSGRGAQ